MTDPVRAAAEKLVQLLDDAAKTPGAPSDDECIAGVEALDNLRTALAQPEPEVVGPSDAQILAAVRHLYGDQTAADMGAEDDLRTVRAFLAHFGGRPDDGYQPRSQGGTPNPPPETP